VSHLTHFQAAVLETYGAYICFRSSPRLKAYYIPT